MIIIKSDNHISQEEAMIQTITVVIIAIERGHGSLDALIDGRKK